MAAVAAGGGGRRGGVPQEPEDLFETISQALVNAFDRDALSGWGAVVHVMYARARARRPAAAAAAAARCNANVRRWPLSWRRGGRAGRSTPTAVITRTLKTRMD